MVDENIPFYIIIGKKTPVSEAKAKLVKYYLQNKKQVEEEKIFEFIDDFMTKKAAKGLLNECKFVLENISVIILPIQQDQTDDGENFDEILKSELNKETNTTAKFYNEIITA